MFAVPTGSFLEEVGTSVEPNTDTISLMPAAAYCDFTAARWSAVRVVHSYALSQAPSVKRKESRLRQDH